MNLPRIVCRLSSIVYRKNHFFATANNDIRIMNNDLGFAPIALVILLLFGIAAGTLLVQNRTNFLPKAARRACTLAEISSCSKRGLTCVSDVGEAVYYCMDVYNNVCGTTDEGMPGLGTPTAENTGRLTIKILCPNGCEVNPISQSYACKSSQTIPCKLVDFKDRSGNTVDTLPYGVDVTGCDSAGNWVNYACLGGQNGLIPTILEQNSSKCSTAKPAPPAQAPAAVSCSSSEDTSCRNEGGSGCFVLREGSDTYKYCKDSQSYGCFDSSRLLTPDSSLINCTGTIPKCGFDKDENHYNCISQAKYDAWKSRASTPATPVGNTAKVEDCTNTTHIAFCKSQATANPSLLTGKCILVDGTAAENTKCVYKTDSTCTPADIAGFTKGCKVITRNSNIGEIKYSVSADNSAAPPAAPAGAPANKAATPTTAGNPAAAAPATAATTSCKDANQTVRAPGRYYQCTGNRTPCDASGNAQVGVPYVCSNGTWSTPNNAGECVLDSACTASFPGISAPSSSTNATADCGYDQDGIKIPCYKIGVFSAETLASTEAGARIASERYAQFSGIVNELKDKINGSVIAAAQAKIKAAEEAAKACLAGK